MDSGSADKITTNEAAFEVSQPLQQKSVTNIFQKVPTKWIKTAPMFFMQLQPSKSSTKGIMLLCSEDLQHLCSYYRMKHRSTQAQNSCHLCYRLAPVHASPQEWAGPDLFCTYRPLGEALELQRTALPTMLSVFLAERVASLMLLKGVWTTRSGWLNVKPQN